ncbi:hypothetical protein ACO1PF_00565 [Alkalibacterium sp. f15]|uniref:hypothetical protein n=1 Tax=Alkalibacterium sp. f15 TaxID=3414029 RepID=UPI003BF83C18
MTDNYTNIPQYLWYHAEGNPPTQKARWWKGKKYVGYEVEPEPNMLDRYKLTYKGTGDFNYIEGLV